MISTEKRIRRSKEELRIEALKYSSKTAFRRESPKHAKTAWRKGIVFWNDITSHMNDLWEPKWETMEQVQEEAYKYTDRTDFARGSSGAYDKAQREGWLDIVCAFMGEKSNESYTVEELKEIATKCGSKQELRKKYPRIYGAIHDKKLVEAMCSHMDVLWEIKWDTFEKIQEEALKYTRRDDFKKNSSGAQDAAIRLNILDQVCAHMEESRRGVSFKEKDLFEVIKNIYPNARKLRDRNVVIKDKPYIKGFEIDVLVGNLGIEFDGTYYHSYEYMRADPKKIKWSDEDVRNYHEIKDAWFATKGIEILHIKEEDWDLDKEACIEKCLTFLRDSDEKQVA